MKIAIALDNGDRVTATVQMSYAAVCSKIKEQDGWLEMNNESIVQKSHIAYVEFEGEE